MTLEEKRNNISRFSTEKEKELKSKYRSFKGKEKKKHLLITGEDGYERYHVIYNLKEVGSPRGGESWFEAINSALFWYSILFDYTKAKIDIYSKNELPEDVRGFADSTIYSSRMGPKLDAIFKH